MRYGFIALAAALLWSPALVDTLIDNANGVQVGTSGNLERFTGLLIGEDGKVLSLLAAGDPRPAAATVIDAQGRTLLPGLIDAHGHVMGLGLAATRLDLVGTASLEDLQQRLRTYSAANPGDSWIVGRGWNQELWPDKRFPTAADLDAIVADRPVALKRVDGHALVVNTAALKAAGISAATEYPAGGRIERDSAGVATGLLIDAAMPLVEQHIPPPTQAQREQALAKAQELLLANGVTAVADMGVSEEDWAVMDAFGRSDRLQVRIIGYAAGMEAMPAQPVAWRHSDRLRLSGVKLYTDGALGSRGAWLKQPYADDPETHGLQFLSDEELRGQVEEAAGRGFQPAVHAIGDAANAQVISAYEWLNQRHSGEGRWRIEHVQIIDPADIPRLAPTGIIASMQPIHQVSDRTMAEARLEPSRLAGAYAWNSIARSGARLAFGSDFPVEPVNPFLGLSAAISRQDPDGVPPGGWLPGEKLSFEQALNAFTRNAAFAGFAEDRIGALEAGKWADFILIDRDPTKVDAQSLARTQVLETWVAGRKVWERE
jgi:predicted amidohydrolase YtcJ